MRPHEGGPPLPPVGEEATALGLGGAEEAGDTLALEAESGRGKFGKKAEIVLCQDVEGLFITIN